MENTIDFCWWCPSAGTQEYLTSGKLQQEQSFDYLKNVAITCEQLKFKDLLIPVSPRCIDPIVAATFLGNVTSKLRLMLAVRPGQWNPIHCARALSSLSLLYPERIVVNLVEGGFLDTKKEGDIVPAFDRPQRRAEFLDILVPILRGETENFEGKFFNIKDCRLPEALIPKVLPEIMISGHTLDAFNLCAKYGSTSLIFGSSINTVSAHISEINSVAKANNRALKIGMAINIFARKTRDEAEIAANRFISKITPYHQQRIALFNRDRPLIDGLYYQKLVSNGYWYNEVLWYGLAAGKTHQRASLVGSYYDVVSEIRKYVKSGISYFILTGDPNLEELLHIGENVIPKLL